MGNRRSNNLKSREAELASSLLLDHQLNTPFLFLDGEKVRDALVLFKRHLPQVKLFYAVKANPAAPLLSFLHGSGLSFDVASEGEINQAMSLGIDGDKLLLTTPIKTPETIAALFRHRVAAFAADTIAELERIAAFRRANALTHAPKVFVRIRIESKQVEIDLNKKFGCSLSEALDLIERGIHLGFEIGGISFHVGTQSTSADNYFLGIESAMLIAKEAARRFCVKVPVINIGGGFADSVTAESAGLNLETFYQSVGEACDQAHAAGFEIYAEPGRCLVSGAGTAVTSVLGTNTRGSGRWVYLDDGVYGCYSIKLYEKHALRFLACRNPRRKSFPLANTPESWTVAGPTCDSLDIIAEQIALPAELDAGDIVLTPNLGAYSIATASAFNGFAAPACYLVESVRAKGRTKAVLVDAAASTESTRREATA